MTKLKKLRLLLCLSPLFLSNFGYTLGLPIGESWNSNRKVEEGASTPHIDDSGIDDKAPILQGSTDIGDKSHGILNNFPQKNDYDTRLGYALALIKIAVNRILGMLAFVTLIYMLYNGFLVLTAGSNDKNVDKGKKGIKNAVIAIAGIGLARLVISAMVWFINVITKANG